MTTAADRPDDGRWLGPPLNMRTPLNGWGVLPIPRRDNIHSLEGCAQDQSNLNVEDHVTDNDPIEERAAERPKGKHKNEYSVQKQQPLRGRFSKVVLCVLAMRGEGKGFAVSWSLFRFPPPSSPECLSALRTICTAKLHMICSVCPMPSFLARQERERNNMCECATHDTGNDPLYPPPRLVLLVQQYKYVAVHRS